MGGPALVAGFESELSCVIAGIPAVDFANLARDNEPWQMQRYGEDLRVKELLNERRVPRLRTALRRLRAALAARLAASIAPAGKKTDKKAK